MKLATCIAVLCFVHIASGAHDFLQEYRFSAALDGNNYMLHWTVDLQAEVINFALNVSTTGWVGFGLSPNGQMPGSDVVIAWIDSNGQVFLAVSLTLLPIIIVKKHSIAAGSVCCWTLPSTS